MTEQERVDLLELLKGIEWAGDDYGDTCCPQCNATTWTYRKHISSCELKAWIDKLEGK